MLFPELLYELSAKDRHQTWLDPFIQTRTLVQAAGSLELAIDLPDDRALLLYNAVARSTVAGAELTNVLMFQLQRGAGGEEFDIAALVLSAGLTSQKLNWQGTLLIPNSPNSPDPWRLRAFFSYSGAADTKTVFLTVFGVLIPPGNIQRTL